MYRCMYECPKKFWASEGVPPKVRCRKPTGKPCSPLYGFQCQIWSLSNGTRIPKSPKFFWHWCTPSVLRAMVNPYKPYPPLVASLQNFGSRTLKFSRKLQLIPKNISLLDVLPHEIWLL